MKKKKQKSTKNSVKRYSRKKYNDNKFFSWLLILLAILVLLLTILWVSGDKIVETSDKIFQSDTDASLILETDNTQVSNGETFVVKVYSNSADVDVNAVSAVILFDNYSLELSEIKSDNSDYPIKAYEASSSGKVEIARGSSDNISGKKFIADIIFKSIKSGDTNIEFDENNTYLVSAETNQDILGSESLKNITIGVK